MLQLIFVGAVVALAQVNGECAGGCSEPLEIYHVVGCKPIYKKPTDCCPFKFDCSSVETRAKDKCTYKGKVFNVNQDIPQELTYPDCRAACRCIASNKVICAALDCPEWLGRPRSPGCHWKYETNKCCSVGEICEPFETCKVDDKTYKEGERFYPKGHRCMECICGKGFKGEFLEPFCTKKSCSNELNDVEKIQSYCAPAYLRDNDCCPFDWICPKDDDVEDKIVASKTTSDADLKCNYGDLKLNVGDTFERVKELSSYDRWETKCECRIPPYVTCTKKQVLDLDKAPEHIRAALSK